MKKIFVAIYLMLFVNIFSQTVEKNIIIKNLATNLPIEGATVLILKTKQVFLSNADGKVSFILKGNSNIQITHTSYFPLQVRSLALTDKEPIIFLKKNVKELDELVVLSQHPQKILAGLVKNSIKTLTIPARLKVYSREFFKLNDVYSYYNDGLLNFQLEGQTKKFKSTVLVEQNRSFGIIDAGMSEDLMGYNLNNLMENYYNFKYLTRLLSSSAKKDYDFIIKVYSSDNSYYLLQAVPKDNAKGLLDNFEIVYNSKQKLIIEIKSYLSEKTILNNKNRFEFGSKKIYKSIYQTVYKLIDDNYYLMSSRETIGFERNYKKEMKKIEVNNYLITTNFSNNNYSYKESELFRDKTLYNKKNLILNKYWTTSGLVATDVEQEIINELEER